MASINCSSCDDLFPKIQLYRCRTCLDQEDIAAAVELFCESCISVLHLKKGHCIMDSKGHEPVVCSDHKNVCTEYCITCKLLVCPKCLRNHRQHEMSTVDEKASEVRSQIFEYLTFLEIKEKPLRVKKEGDEIVVKANLETVQNMCTFIETKLDRIKLSLLNNVKENAKSESLTEIESVIVDMVEMQQKCRDQLNLSSDSLIEASSKLAEEFPKIKKRYEEETSKIITPQNDHTDKLRVEFDKFHQKVSEQMLAEINELYLIETTATEETKTASTNKDKLPVSVHHVCFHNLDSLYQMRVSQSEQKISVAKVDTSSDKHRMGVFYNLKCNFDSPVTHVFPLFFKASAKKYIYILFENKTAVKYAVGAKTLSPCEYPGMTHFLWPYVVGDSGHPSWSYWSPCDRTVRFTHDKGFVVRMLTRPHVKMGSYNPSCIYFIADNLNISIADVDRKSLQFIPSSVHKLESIDSVSGGNSKVFLWCDVRKMVKIFSFDEGKLITKRNVMWWSKQWEIFTIDLYDGSKCFLMPVLKNYEGSNNDEYPVYACKYYSRS
ncbi:uncharacterized protein LOC142353895 [Convolutriloba macropyga]|uniref:uncharacterized protein LOC142353895 n=1 Tax=Convolutriloba macropyga TaxID=536237 RepID=UPI003F51CA6D